MKKIILILGLAFLLSAAIATQEKTIEAELKYNPLTLWDSNDDGIEVSGGVIDFVLSPRFSWQLNESNICSEWQIEDVDGVDSKSFCQGSARCCLFLDESQVSDQWDDKVSVDQYKYFPSENKRVSARIVHIDYDFGENPYSDIYSSDWDYLYAVFLSGDGITIRSPKANETTGALMLRVDINETSPLSYKLDDGLPVFLGEGKNFSDRLNGTLRDGILRNGVHNVTIYLNRTNQTHEFQVNDAAAPSIHVQWKGMNLSAVSSLNLMVNMSVLSDEYAVIAYEANNGAALSALSGVNATIGVLGRVGNNQLVINATDVHGNSMRKAFNYTFSYEPTCSDGEQNGQETGIDCGGSCSSCVPFEMALNKHVFSDEENILVTILAREDSQVRLNVTKNGIRVYDDLITSFSPGFPIFLTKSIEIGSLGTYQINALMRYLNRSERKSDTFVVEDPQNPLLVSITSNRTRIEEGEAVRFSASVAGNTTPLSSLLWAFGDGQTSSAENPAHSFLSSGTYTVNLSVSWNGWTGSESTAIIVDKVLEVIISVRNQTGPLENAAATLGKRSNLTGPDGIAKFRISSGTHALSISKEGYLPFSNSSLWIQSTAREVILEKNIVDTRRPVITIISPPNGSTFQPGTAHVLYSVDDASTVNCSLYIEALSGWLIQASNSQKPSGADSFSLPGLSPGIKKWKIECVDKGGNRGSSSEGLFIVNQTDASNPGSPDTDAIEHEIVSFLGRIGSLDKKERDAAEALGLEKMLHKKRTALQRAKRDLSNLVWRKLNSAEFEKERLRLIRQIEDIRRTTPKSIEVIDSSEFINYPSNEDIRKISLMLSDNIRGKREREKYVRYNKDLQNNIKATTRFIRIEAEYISGDREFITAFEKKVNLLDKSIEAALIEIIPKAIAANVSQIGFTVDFESVEEDPIVRILSPSDKFSYYVMEDVALSDAQGVKTILIGEDISSAPPITGFAVLTEFPYAIGEKTDIWIAIEILMIIILAISYITLSGGFRHLKYVLFQKQALRLQKRIFAWVEDSKRALDADDYQKAKEIYKSIIPGFRGLPSDLRKKAYAMITQLCGKLDAYYINKLLDNAVLNLENGQKEAARKIYLQVRGIYKNIAPGYRAVVLQRCNEIYAMLQK